MKLEQLNDILKSASGFENRVAYNAWQSDQAPDMPYIVYALDENRNFYADGKIYAEWMRIIVRLFTKIKNLNAEAAVEAALDENGIIYSKSESYDSDNQAYIISYGVEI